MCSVVTTLWSDALYNLSHTLGNNITLVITHCALIFGSVWAGSEAAGGSMTLAFLVISTLRPPLSLQLLREQCQLLKEQCGGAG